MIRIKCPKCSFTLSLDDAEAGKVGECTECGAKFRVPARKAGAPARAGKDEEEKRRPAPRAQDDEDDEQDDADEQGNEPRKSPKKRKSKGAGTSALVMAGGFLVAIIILGIGGIYIHDLALVVAGVSALLWMSCGLMIAREAMADSTGKFLMVWAIPLYLLYFVYENWDRTRQLFVPYLGFLALAAVSVGAFLMQQDRVVERRKEIRKIADKVEVVMVRTTGKSSQFVPYR